MNGNSLAGCVLSAEPGQKANHDGPDSPETESLMKIGGWKTMAMFSRYNVMSSDRIKASMERGGAYVAEAVGK